MSNLNELARAVHKDACDAGWYDEGKTKSDVESMMLVVTEIAEAVEELRKPDGKLWYVGEGGKPEGYGVEVADAVIRLLDFAAYRGIDLDSIIMVKREFNKSRGYRHGGKKY